MMAAMMAAHDGANEESRRPKKCPAKSVFPESINTLHDFHRCFDGESGLGGGGIPVSREMAEQRNVGAVWPACSCVSCGRWRTVLSIWISPRN
jgi:hypothetical protein